MTQTVYVAGVGMIPFAKPGSSAPYPEMGATAARTALQNAGIPYAQVQQAFVGYVYGDSTCGQRALYDVGMSGIPIVNVNNNCSTGSTALYLARQSVANGAAECTLALGFEQMNPGALGAVYSDRQMPFDRFDAVADDIIDQRELPFAIRYFGGAGLAYMQQYGATIETFAKVKVKASQHAAHNEFALLRKVVTEDEVLNAPVLWPGVMTRLMACPPTCGAAAAVLCSEAFAARHGLDRQVRIRAQAMTSDRPVTFAARDMRQLCGYSMVKEAAQQVYEAAGVGPGDVDVVELHDCFAQNEVLSYEALALCPEGGAEQFIRDGDNTYGGRVVTNPSGGLLSKGHPLGATGLAQCTELVEQLRGVAGRRQVRGARLALQHNVGLGGACVVTLYERTGIRLQGP
ncbi:MAG: lipid-transfer protein [Gammaproteobacteria bacterium]|nr:MAG: lipid-transfer protein [Gammaproteobacteria bacterium]